MGLACETNWYYTYNTLQYTEGIVQVYCGYTAACSEKFLRGSNKFSESNTNTEICTAKIVPLNVLIHVNRTSWFYYLAGCVIPSILQYFRHALLRTLILFVSCEHSATTSGDCFHRFPRAVMHQITQILHFSTEDCSGNPIKMVSSPALSMM